jgi:hypothetical protein
LNITVSSPQSSACLSLPIGDAAGVTTGGTEIPKNALNGGQVTASGAESLLQALIRTNGQRYIVLYGQPGVTFTVQTSSSLSQASGNVGHRLSGDSTERAGKFSARIRSKPVSAR